MAEPNREPATKAEIQFAEFCYLKSEIEKVDFSPRKNGLATGMCGRQDNGSPQIIHILIHETYVYITLYGKRNFLDVNILGILRWGDYAELSGWAQWNYKNLYKKEAGEQEGQS